MSLPLMYQDDTQDYAEYVDDIDHYEEVGRGESFHADQTTSGIKGMYLPSPAVNRVRQAPSDRISLATYPIPDSTPTAPALPIKVVTARAQGIASKVRVTIAPVAGSTSVVYLLQTPSAFGTMIAYGTSFYLSTGLYLGTASNTLSAPYELLCTGELWAVSLNSVIGAGSLVSVGIEMYNGE